MVKNLLATAGDARDVGSILGGEDPLQQEAAAAPIFCLQNAMERNLAGYSLCGRSCPDMTEACMHVTTRRPTNLVSTCFFLPFHLYTLGVLFLFSCPSH